MLLLATFPANDNVVNQISDIITDWGRAKIGPHRSEYHVCYFCDSTEEIEKIVHILLGVGADIQISS